MNPNPRVVETGADVPSDNNMVGRMRCLEGVTMIAPNESRRKETLMIAQKEEDELQKWKEANRHTHVHTTPERLGGNATLAEVRERQFKDLRCSKMEKKVLFSTCQGYGFTVNGKLRAIDAPPPKPHLPLEGVTMIAPNESRRKETLMSGNATLAEVRERQFKDLRCSKMEKKAECLEEQKQVKEKKRQEQLRQDCAQ
ncbi:uncharacterized protein epsti1 [Hippocampus comes]|uniref:uncharacterized protein epsti1 n=1 Tax=Hippocampus comes TaxID=109280 RepID=UPI00094E2B90|nr:PREDICTED: epithelial-stromal interaction protein 1 [Hippocampus comes]